MTDRKKVPIVVADPSDRRFPAFPPDVLEELFELANEASWLAGDALYRARTCQVCPKGI